VNSKPVLKYYGKTLPLGVKRPRHERFRYILIHEIMTRAQAGCEMMLSKPLKKEKEEKRGKRRCAQRWEVASARFSGVGVG
jgi:hypothetical protein